MLHKSSLFFPSAALPFDIMWNIYVLFSSPCSQSCRKTFARCCECLLNTCPVSKKTLSSEFLDNYVLFVFSTIEALSGSISHVWVGPSLWFCLDLFNCLFNPLSVQLLEFTNPHDRWSRPPPVQAFLISVHDAFVSEY